MEKPLLPLKKTNWRRNYYDNYVPIRMVPTPSSSTAYCANNSIVGMASPNICKMLRLLRLDGKFQTEIESLKQTIQSLLGVNPPPPPPQRDISERPPFHMGLTKIYRM